MNDLRTAAQQALEALLDDPNKLVQISEHHWESKRDLAVIAIRAALAEPVLEPVAWEQFHEHMTGPFYRAPPQRKPLTEDRNFCPRCGKRSFPDTIHTCTPP